MEPQRSLGHFVPCKAKTCQTCAKLETYRAKRNFSKTRWPKGRLRTASVETRRFVIQKHAASRLLYDLRLEVANPASPVPR
jgi:hypothetical protein